MLFTHFHARSCLFCMCSSLNTRAPAGKARHLQSERFGCLHAAGTTAAAGMCLSQEPVHTACLENTVNVLPDPEGHNKGDISSAQTTAKIWPEHQRQRETQSKHVTKRKAASFPKECQILWSHPQSLSGKAQIPESRQVCWPGSVILKKANHCNSCSRQNNFELTFCQAPEHKWSYFQQQQAPRLSKKKNGSCDCSPLLTIRWLVVKCLHLQKKTAGSQASFSLQVQAGVFECRQQPNAFLAKTCSLQQKILKALHG